jgi:outer membrane lipoprotein carrier protein
MKLLSTLLLTFAYIHASMNNLDSFEATFVQTITDEKSKVIQYEGSVLATKPQNALWSYKSPITKDVYVQQNLVTIIEPEIEQVIIKRITSDLNIFELIKKAKKISKGLYEATYMNKKYIIAFKDDLLESISYKDEFDNSVKILFEKQKQNKEINPALFTPNIPTYFDIIRE